MVLDHFGLPSGLVVAPEPTEAVAAREATHTRVRAGMRRRHNWVQLVKFCAVGGSGYVVNLAVFALVFSVLGLAPPRGRHAWPSSWR